MNRGAAVEATVQVGDMEIPYVCTGRGPTVLVLELPGAESADEGALRGWAERFRVIRTRLPAGEAPAPRVMALVEGLGVEGPPVLLVGGDGESLPGVLEALEECGEGLGVVRVLGDPQSFPGD